MVVGINTLNMRSQSERKVVKPMGVVRTFWVPAEMDSIIEETRRSLGMSKSSFYRYAIMRFLQEINVLSSRARGCGSIEAPGGHVLEEDGRGGGFMGGGRC